MRIIPSTIKSKLFNIISDAEAHIDEFVLNPGKDMTRHRDCTFSDTILTIMNFAMNRLNTELFHFFADKQNIWISLNINYRDKYLLSVEFFYYISLSVN